VGGALGPMSLLFLRINQTKLNLKITIEYWKLSIRMVFLLQLELSKVLGILKTRNEKMVLCIENTQ
jgi:hypothetical protein